MAETATTTTAAAQPSATDLYALGRDPVESTRLQRQSAELRPDSAALLDRVGLRPGQCAIELGCGPSGIIERSPRPAARPAPPAIRARIVTMNSSSPAVLGRSP